MNDRPEGRGGSSIRRRIVRNTASNSAGKVVTLAIWFALTPFVLHHLGATEYGLWVLVTAIVGYGSVLDLGISNAITKYVAEHRARGDVGAARELVATALCLYTALGVAVLGVSAVLAPLVPSLFRLPADIRSDASAVVLLTGLAMAILLPATAPLAVLRGLQRFDLINLLSVAGTTLSAAATVAVLLLGGGIVGLAAVNAPMELLMQVPALWLIRRDAPELRFGWRGASRAMARRVASFSASIFVINTAANVKMKTDEIVIAAFLPVANVTPYALGRRLSVLPQLFADQLAKVLMPVASELDALEDRARLRALYVTGTRLTAATAMVAGLSIAILARPLLTAWVGEQYAGAATITALLAGSAVLEVSMWPSGTVLQGMARHRPIAAFAFGSAVANLALSLILVHPLGTEGVALATLIATGVESTCFVVPYGLRVLGVGLTETVREVVVPVLAPVVPAGAVLLALRAALGPDSLVALAFVAALCALIYAVAYLGCPAAAPERQAIGELLTHGLRRKARTTVG